MASRCSLTVAAFHGSDVTGADLQRAGIDSPIMDARIVDKRCPKSFELDTISLLPEFDLAR
ncbi:hypothetical protein BTW08_02695 [Salinicola sp. MH3R3-1]|nr:hypothetical protein BTW08_02695 [Salinicola sp. MH3R3-1]